MPMYQPNCYRRDGNVNLDMGSGGQVLDLETAVKDGILGGGCGGGGGGGGGGLVSCGDKDKEKLDIKKMIKELESIEVPLVFICPISLDPMQDPVTLCTGQTYERSNILKWFSLGHYTCPTTMQELWDTTLTPNRTLQQLIYSWFAQKYLSLKKRSEDVQGRAIEILETLKSVKGQARVQALKELRRVVAANAMSRKTVLSNGGLSLVCSLLGPFTSHAVGSEAIGILVNLDLDFASKAKLREPSKLSLMVDMLHEGSIETKINCMTLIRMLMEGKDFNIEDMASLSLLAGLLRLVKDRRHPNGVSTGLGLLKTICLHESVRSSVVSIGVIPPLVELLPSLNKECLELALFILQVLSTIPEGRLALKDCPNTIRNVVKLLMKVSEHYTHLALLILWAICKLAPEEFTTIAVEAGLAAKLLLVIQSGYNPVLKQQAVELLKLCSLNHTPTIFISKCKLTKMIH